MRLILAASAVLVVLLLTACGSSRNQFRAEEYRDGWALDVRDDGDVFRARWIKGENHSAKIVNYYDADRGGSVVVNTLYLELDDNGDVVQGRLKRVVVPEFAERHYYESSAQWFRVLDGWCRLNHKAEGTLQVQCEGGYEFKGDVTASDDLNQESTE